MTTEARRPPSFLKVKVNVYDRWWPWRAGTVVKRLKTRVRVLWSDGEIWTYDIPHMQFLEKL